MKHAYCIIAHNEPELFHRLIASLDYPDNDIFVHIDRVSDISLFAGVKCEYSGLYFLPKRRRCRWGSLEIVKAEMDLFEFAEKKGQYSYYHLLSGVDFPLKSQKFIHEMLDKTPEFNYIGFAKGDSSDQAVQSRAYRYHLFVRRPGSKNPFDKILSRINQSLLKIQRSLAIKRDYPFTIKKGAQWVSVNSAFCKYLLNVEEEYIKKFRFMRAPDEFFIQTVFSDSPFAGTQYSPDGDEYEQCLREIDWQRGSPYTWKSSDIEQLKSSRKLFARKFSSSYMDVVVSLSESIDVE